MGGPVAALDGAPTAGVVGGATAGAADGPTASVADDRAAGAADGPAASVADDRAAGAADGPAASVADDRAAGAADGPTAGAADDLILRAATLLFVNGQTTERTIEATERLAVALGCRASLLPRWGELTLRVVHDRTARVEVAAADPVGVDMGRVAATNRVIDGFCNGKIGAGAVAQRLCEIGVRRPVSLARFACMAALGAAALGVIFGVAHPPSLALIALCAGAGACLRRGLAGVSRNPLIQPFAAALLAGGVGGVVAHAQPGASQLLVAVCPCMVLVPGPHLLNGAMDLVRARVALGAARVGFAGLVIVMICAGLLLGLSAAGISLPVSGPAVAVPLVYDVAAAGVAVAAYGSFFGMPWRSLPIPIGIGMLAHAGRWMVIARLGGSIEVGAFVACLLVGVVMTPIADRLRLPFAALAFASVVSLIPGVFLFRVGGGLVVLAMAGAQAPPGLLLGIVADGSTALLIILAMTFGLVFPKLVIEHFVGPPGGVAGRGAGGRLG
ncbi:threonine/serine exporter family protein [Rhodopila sp.]|uniref:threonine/serine exporter family protein n=1 Tax=Rhodopila sp. TaxID=2480087 RepID=UPI003D13C096